MQQIRVIKPTRRSMSGYYSYKGISIPYESTLERDFVVFHTFRSDVLRIVAQPVRIAFIKNGRTYHYTPDYFVQFNTSAKPLIVEVKPKNEWLKYWREWSDKWKATIEYCKEQGYIFKIYDESRIRHQGLKNVEKLMRYERINCSNNDIEAVLKQVETMGTTTIELLLEKLFKEETCHPQGKRIIYHLIANKILEFPLRDELNEKTEIWHA